MARDRLPGAAPAEGGPASALAAFALETGLTRRFGFELDVPARVQARVIAGVAEKVIDAFSSRRTEITTATLALVEAVRAAPRAARSRISARWRACASSPTRDTRKGKDDGRAGLHRGCCATGRQTSRAQELGTLRDLARKIWPAPAADERDARAGLGGDSARLRARAGD